MIENAENVVRKVVAEWQPGVMISSISALTPDASLRRYFRVSLGSLGGAMRTVVAMVFDSVTSPEASGAPDIPSDEAYVSLTRFFNESAVAVPRLYFDARQDGVLIIEDAGDTLLADVALGLAGAKYSEAEVEALYRQAIDQIFRIQKIPKRSDFFAFQRSFHAETYIREMEELRDYSLATVSLGDREKILLSQLFQDIAKRLTQMPLVLCHRDYHPWNLMVCDDSVKIIDFQDALMATPNYDVVALLNDRDGDAMLGIERYNRLVHVFSDGIGCTGEQYFVDFALVLLQRDLKVAGRFEKLVSVRKLPQYGRWIAGTQARISRSLRFLMASGAVPALYRDSLEVLGKHLPNIASEGRKLFDGV